MCPEILAVLPLASTTSFGANNHHPRAEIRRCDGILVQVAVWGDHPDQPPRLIETEQAVIEQVVAVGRVLVLETSGETSNRVFGITLKNGLPRLAFSFPTKGKVVVTGTRDGITVTAVDSKSVRRRLVLKAAGELLPDGVNHVTR